jgi:hypothetical protein
MGRQRKHLATERIKNYVGTAAFGCPAKAKPSGFIVDASPARRNVEERPFRAA